MKIFLLIAVVIALVGWVELSAALSALHQLGVALDGATAFSSR